MPADGLGDVRPVRSGRRSSRQSDGARSDLVQSLAHGLTILSLFSDAKPVVGVGEMARSLGVHRSSASRLAATLSTHGYLTPTSDQGRYRLGRQLVQLGELATHELDLRNVATEALSALVDDLGDTAHLGVLEGSEAMTIALVDGWHSVRLHSAVGKRAPAHCSSIGKALLAGLDDERLSALYRGQEQGLERRTANTIGSLTELRRELVRSRSRGYTLDNEELELGLRCVGAPVFDRTGSLVAAISVSGPVTRFQGEVLRKAKRSVRYVAFAISVRLGCAPPSAHWGDRPPFAGVSPQLAAAFPCEG
jgi:DNA-binding IclR family transcriptional regulator